MSEHLQHTANAFVQRFGAQIHEFRGQISLLLPSEYIVDASRSLRDDFAFEMLSAVTAVDYWPQEGPRFNLIYIFYSLTHNERLSLRVALNGHSPSVHSITGVYPNANWHERETMDMFGIHFEGHPDPRRILMPEDWEGHPLRKDYPLGYEEVQFSFNYDEIDARKPYAKE